MDDRKYDIIVVFSADDIAYDFLACFAREEGPGVSYTRIIAAIQWRSIEKWDYDIYIPSVQFEYQKPPPVHK